MGDFFTAPVDAFTDLGSFIYNVYSHERDYANYIDERDYNRALQQQIFEREDTAYSRAVNDMLNAGLSPVSASSANSGAVVSTPSRSASQINPTELLALQREVQNGYLASEESNRQQALAESQISFTGQQIDKMIGDSAREDKRLAINALQQETKMYLDYNLAMEDLKEKGKSREQNLAIAKMQNNLQERIFENDKLMQSFGRNLQQSQYELEARKQAFAEQQALRQYFFDLDKENAKIALEAEKIEQDYLRQLSDIGQFLLNPFSDLFGNKNSSRTKK